MADGVCLQTRIQSQFVTLLLCSVAAGICKWLRARHREVPESYETGRSFRWIPADDKLGAAAGTSTLHGFQILLMMTTRAIDVAAVVESINSTNGMLPSGGFAAVHGDDQTPIIHHTTALLAVSNAGMLERQCTVCMRRKPL